MPETARTPIIYAIVSFNREDGGSASLETFSDPQEALESYNEVCAYLYDTSTEEFVAIYADGEQTSVVTAGLFDGEDADSALTKVAEFLGLDRASLPEIRDGEDD